MAINNNLFRDLYYLRQNLKQQELSKYALLIDGVGNKDKIDEYEK